MVEVRGAANFLEFFQSLRLVHDQYVKAKLMDPHPSGLRLFGRDLLPTAATFVAVKDNDIIGTHTANLLGVADLPCSYLYEDIIKGLKQDGYRIAETTKFACIPSKTKADRGLGRLSLMGTELMRCLFYWCVAHNVSDWLIVIPPRATDIYEGELGFRQIGSFKSCSHVKNNPGILMTLKVQEILNGTTPPTEGFEKFILNRPLPLDECKHSYLLTERESDLLVTLDGYRTQESRTPYREESSATPRLFS